MKRDKKKNFKKRFLKVFGSLVLTVALAVIGYQQNVARAAALTTLSDTMSNLNDGEVSNHDIRFRTLSGMSSSTMKIYFNTAGFDDGSVDHTDIDLQYGSSQSEVNGSCSSSCTKATLAGSAGAGAWGAAFTTNDLTFTYPTSGGTAIAANDYVRVLIGTNATYQTTGDQQITNPGSTGTKVITIEVAGTTDTGKLAAVVVAEDKVTVTATINPSITFSLSATSTDFGVVSPGVIDTADTNVTLTVGTNAASGYAITVQDQGNSGNPGLYSSGASYLIGSADGSYADTGDLSSLSLGYGIQVTCTSGCTTNTHVSSQYRQGSETVGGLETSAENMVTYSSTMSADHMIQVVHKMKAASTTPSGIYNDSITYIATGNF